MKRLLVVVSLVVLALGAWLIRSFVVMPRTGAEAGTESSRPTSIAIDLDIDSREFAGLSEREQLDQIRDWLLLVALQARGTAPEEIDRALFDLPPVRRDELQPVSNFEYGDTRYAVIGDGIVVALVPDASEVPASDLLAGIADRARQALGDVPRRFEVVQYSVDLLRGTATLANQPTIPGADLFTESAGYVETRISKADDVRRFTVATDDLVHARVDGGALVLGGRRWSQRAPRPMNVEDVAALWQSEIAIDGKRALLERLAKTPGMTQEQFAAEVRRQRIVDGSGFSLDPTFDYERMVRLFEGRLGALLQEAAGVTEQQLAAVRARLVEHDDSEFYLLLRQLSQSDPGLPQMILRLSDQCCRFQQARYDGELRGTEVGMTLFYCDLLAKLWKGDRFGSSPRSVDGFTSEASYQLPELYRAEITAIPATRLWFAPREDAFQVRDSGAGQTLLLQPTATRIFAASSDLLEPGVEVEANSSSRRFLGWWNDHYQELSRYEPEYERLNQIVKWSILIRWVRDRGAVSGLDQLGSDRVGVRRDNWFPEWAARQQHLRFSGWSRIPFEGRRGPDDTERLPLLPSRQFALFRGDPPVWSLSGGVSLAERNLVSKRTALNPDLPAGLRRGGLEFSNTTAERLTTQNKVTFQRLRPSPGRFEVRASIEAGRTFSGRTAQFSGQDALRVLEASPEGIRLGYAVGNVPVGTLNLTQRGSRFRVGWQGRDLDATLSLARRLARQQDPGGVERALAGDLRVAEAHALKEGEYLVRFDASDQWAQLSLDKAPAARLPDGWYGRTGDFDTAVGGVNFKFVSSADAHALRGSGRVVRSADGPGPRLPEVPKGSAPGEIRAKVRDQLASRLVEVDAALDRGGTGIVARVDELIEVFGPLPELTARRAVAQIAEGNAGGAARTINRVGLSEDGANAFFNELGHQLARHDTPAIRNARQQLDAFRQWAGHSRGMDRGLAMAGNADGLVPICAIGEQSEARAIRSASELPEGPAIVYVQDKAGVYYLDPSLSARSQLSGLLASGRLEHLPAGDIAQYRPAALHRTQQAGVGPGVSLRRIGTTGRGAASLGRCNEQEAEGGGSGCPRVYLYTPAQPGN
jgi:hypothetical protein